MSNRLYKRFIQLTLIKPNVALTQTHGFFVQLPNAVTIRDLRVAFHIEKNTGKRPNKASVTVTNMALTTRALFDKKPLIVQLAVGYDGEKNLTQLFSGDLRIADTVHEGPDVNTKFQMGEGDRAYTFGHVSRSFAGGSKVLDVVKGITDSIGLELPPSIAAARDLQTEYTGGSTIHGPFERELTSALTPIGMSWSIQDGNRLVILKDTQVRENEAVLIEEGKGMIGSPAFGTPKKLGENPMLKVKTLINPLIKAGGKIVVRSRDINGTFRVERLTNTGDTRGPNWYTEIAAKQL